MLTYCFFRKSLLGTEDHVSGDVKNSKLDFWEQLARVSGQVSLKMNLKNIRIGLFSISS